MYFLPYINPTLTLFRSQTDTDPHLEQATKEIND